MSPAADDCADGGPVPAASPRGGAADLGLHKQLDDALLGESMRELADGVRPWERGSFTMVRRLQDAERNHGRVDAMSYQGHNVAVKRMPNWWVLDDHRAFQNKHRSQLERPWVDFGVAAELQRAQFPYVCELIGIYRDDSCTYAVSSLASDGDLFQWAQQAPGPGPQREEAMRPLVAQIFDAARLLHDLGVSHRDISLENVLVTRQDSEAELQVRLIDFGMAGLGRWHGGPGRRTPGKPYYKAPELHAGVKYDAFLSDDFALGILLYAMALASYPWEGTTPGLSAAFDMVSECGTMEFFSRRMLNGVPLPEVLSEELLQVLSGLLAVSPRDRMTVSEACFDSEERPSALASAWLRGSIAIEQKGPEACQAALHTAASTASLSTMASKDDDGEEDSVAVASTAKFDEEEDLSCRSGNSEPVLACQAS